MPVIHLETLIAAPRERVFNLSRSMDAHMASAADTHERAVAGVTCGLLEPGGQVTWEARHFCIRQQLTVKMTKFDAPNFFQDTMIEGAFQMMKHDHVFEETPGGTLMMDRFEFTSPLGWLGRIFDVMVLERYMRKFLLKRNAILKQLAESEEWKPFLVMPTN